MIVEATLKVIYLDGLTEVDDIRAYRLEFPHSIEE